MANSRTPEETAQKLAVWERHGQTILLSIITTTLIGTATILYNSNATQASMAAEIRALQTQVGEMRIAITAMQQHYVSRPEFQNHEQRIQALESRR